MGVGSYGSGVDANATRNSAGLRLGVSHMRLVNALLDSGAKNMRYQIEWWGIERAVQTTSNTAISVTGSVTITPAVMLANFVVGASILVDSEDDGSEVVTITAKTSTTISFVATLTHMTTPYPVAAVPLAGDTPGNCGSPARVLAYDWSVVDDYVATCQTYGLNAVFVVQSAPDWHAVAQACDGRSIPDPTAIPAFLTALLSRYPAGTFYAIEANNEGYNASPPCSDMFSGQGLTTLQNVRNAVNAYSPTTLVGAMALNKYGVTDVTTWMTNFYAANLHTYVDYLNYHYYNDINGPDSPAGGEDSFIQIAHAVHAASSANNDAKRPIWVSEIGWNYNLVGDSTLVGYINAFLIEAKNSGCIQWLNYYSLDSITDGGAYDTASYQAWKSCIQRYPRLQMSTYQATVLADSPIRYYRLDEASGTVVHDLGSQAQDGALHGGVTLNQAGLLVGNSDTAMSFNSTSGYISMPTTSLPTGANAWSMEAWINVPTLAGSGEPMICCFGTNTGNQVAILDYNGSTKNFEVTSWADVPIATGTIGAATTYHLVATYDGTSIRLYINGALAAGPTAYIYNIGTTYARIGSDNATDWFNGIIDEAAIYSTALSQSQVTAHYNAGVSQQKARPHGNHRGFARMR